MGFKIYATLLLLLISIHDGTSFGRKRNTKCRKEYEQPVNADDQNLTPDCYYNCDPTQFGIVQKIPHLQSCSSCDAIEIDFSSACVRCGMCLAVAEKINQTLLDVHEMLLSTYMSNTEVELLLRTICDNCFQYHSLQEIGGKRFIAERIPGAIFVSTSADGLWAKKLKGLCHYYLDEIGEMELYKQWLQWCNDGEKFPVLSNVLCRSLDGVLRDCRSIGDIEKHEPDSWTYNAKMRINAWFDKSNKGE